MSIQVIVAYSKNEAELANNLIVPIIEAGFRVWHRDSVLTGDSISAEACEALEQNGPVVLCATTQAVGAKWTRRIIHAARERGKKVFIAQMDDEADVDSLSLGENVASYFVDSKKAIDDLILAIKSNYSLQISTNEENNTQILELESRYSEIALKSFDIIDLTNLPDSDNEYSYKASRT